MSFTNYQAGNIYVQDDAGGIVFQTFAPSSSGVTGTVTMGSTAPTSVTINANNALSATSYKDPNCPVDANDVILQDDVIVNSLSSQSGITLPTNHTFLVLDSEGHLLFYVYSYCQSGDESNLNHCSGYPQHSYNPPSTTTEALGDLYIQYSNVIYKGTIASTTPIKLQIPNGDF